MGDIKNHGVDVGRVAEIIDQGQLESIPTGHRDRAGEQFLEIGVVGAGCGIRPAQDKVIGRSRGVRLSECHRGSLIVCIGGTIPTASRGPGRVDRVDDGSIRTINPGSGQVEIVS